MPSAETWLDLEILILTEVIQIDRQITRDIAHMRNLKKAYKWTYLQNWNRVTDKFMVAGVGKGRIWASQEALVVKNLPTKAGDVKWCALDPWVGKLFLAWRIPWTGVWPATVHGVAKSQTWLKWLNTHTHKRDINWKSGLTHTRYYI